MHRARTLRWLAPLLVLLPASLLSVEAEAAPPQRGGGFDEGGYIQGSPGVIAFTVDNDDFNRNFDIAWPWHFGGGWMFARGPLFKATLGGSFEHHIMFFDDVDFDDFNAHSLHFLAESRIGAGTNRVWGYGLIGIGPGVTIMHWDNPVFDDTEAFGGINFQFGAGVQGIVYRNLFLGGEFDFDAGLYFVDDDDFDNDWDDFDYTTATLKFLIGRYL